MRLKRRPDHFFCRLVGDLLDQRHNGPPQRNVGDPMEGLV